jgi:hypothetical protein
MKNEFVPYEQALALKELESDEPYLGECFGEYRQWDGGKPYLQLYQDLDGCSTDPADYEYTTECSAPTYSQAFRWFREKHKLMCYPEPTGSWRYSCRYRGEDENGKHWSGYLRDLYNEVIIYDSFEEAELACLKKLIKLSTETNKP